MRILQINSVCGRGSTGRIAADLHRYLTDRGHESRVAFGRWDPQDCESTIRIGSKWDVYSHAAAARFGDRTGFWSKSATKRFLGEIEKYNPDIIHLHNIHGYYLHIGELFAFLKRFHKPVVWTLHDCWPFTGHCTYFDYVNCQRWKTGCYACPQKKTYPKRLWIDSSQRNYEDKKSLFTNVEHLTLVSPSRWLAGQVKQSFLSAYPIEVIPNGIDLQTFYPMPSTFRKDYGILDNQFLVLAAANVWEERKGLSFYIELAKRMQNECAFVVVGVTEKQRRSLPAGMIGITRTNSAKELARIYSAADVFVNTTFEDNFPTTNLESLACGTPVITFRTGGSVESVGSEEKKTGLIVEQGDVNALMQAVRQIKENTKAAYFTSCVSKARGAYDKEMTYARYLELYQSLI